MRGGQGQITGHLKAGDSESGLTPLARRALGGLQTGQAGSLCTWGRTLQIVGVKPELFLQEHVRAAV